jgi:hypothetical protein
MFTPSARKSTLFMTVVLVGASVLILLGTFVNKG